MDKKLLIMSLAVIIAAAIVFFNFEEFTGQAGRLTVLEKSLAAQPQGEGSVSVEPKVITSGEKIYITIKPGDRCIDNEITIYKKGKVLPAARFEKSAKYKGSTTGISKYCGEGEAIIKYKTWNSWEGDYYVEVKELPQKVTGKIKSRTTYYTDDFEIKKAENYPKLIISKIGSLIDSPQKIFGQRYIFKD